MSPWDLVMIILSLNLNLITSLYTTYNLHIKVKSALPGGLPSMGSHRVGHNCSDLAAAAAAHHYVICAAVSLFGVFKEVSK